MRISKDPYPLSPEGFHCFVHSCLLLVEYCWGWERGEKVGNTDFRGSLQATSSSLDEQKVMACVSLNR